MRCVLLTLPLLALAAMTGGHLSAQTADAPAAAPVQTSPAVAESATHQARAISSETAAKLTASLPKIAPLKTSDARPAEPPPDLRETDKPRNAIVRLPSYIVREPKPPVFKERELLTPKGRVDLARKRFPGLRIGSLPFLSNDGIGLFMLAEEERLERMKEAADLMSLLRYGNGDPKGEIKAKVQQSFMRPGF
jgi:hypothetical protein